MVASAYISKRPRKIDHARVIALNCCGVPSRQIAARLHTKTPVVVNILKAYGIRSDFRSGGIVGRIGMCGAKNPNWNGGVHRHQSGYIKVLLPQNVHADRKGYIREHVLLIEKKLGRSLKFYGVNDRRNEVVHHINGNKSDNREENLAVMTHGEHVSFHTSRSLEWPSASGKRTGSANVEQRQGAA